MREEAPRRAHSSEKSPADHYESADFNSENRSVGQKRLNKQILDYHKLAGFESDSNEEQRPRQLQGSTTMQKRPRLGKLPRSIRREKHLNAKKHQGFMSD